MRKTKAEQVWQTALGELQMQVTRATFETWVKDTRVLSYEDGEFIVGVHSAFAKDWIENRLLSTIKRALTRIMGRSVGVSFAVWSPVEDETSFGPLWKRPATRDEHREALNVRYTFDQFVVGPAN